MPKSNWKKRALEAEQALEEMHKAYTSACSLVAEMHEAAVGKITGSSFGVVEDIKQLRHQYLTLRRGMELAWTIIANAYGGNWSQSSAKWLAATISWREKYWNSEVIGTFVNNT